MQDKNLDSKKFTGRRENRVAAMQILYMLEIGKSTDVSAQMSDFFSERDKPREFFSFAEELVAGVLSHKEEVDAVISKSAKNWAIDRIAKVDLSILRLAAFELLFREDIPPVVSINEAIDLSKTFASSDSRRFINGVLDNIKASLKRPLRAPARADKSQL